MKKTRNVLLVLAWVLTAAFARSQSPTTCSTAISKSYPLTTFSETNYSDSVYWFTMNLDSGNFSFKINNTPGNGDIISGTVYSGACNSLVGVFKDTIMYGDSLLWLDFNLTSSTTIYFKLSNSGSNTAFSVIAPPEVFIVGQVAFCPGQSITLFPECVNCGTATPSMTWTPGNSNSYSITISPLSSTTYTIKYNDGTTGVLTKTVNVAQLPADVCNSCDYVNNGHFEWWGYNTSYFPTGFYNLQWVLSHPNWLVPAYSCPLPYTFA